MYHKTKYSRYTKLQKKMIYREYCDKTNLSEISKKYNVSISSRYKIVNNYNELYNFKGSPNKEINTDKYLSFMEQNFIQHYVEPQILLTIQSINDEVNKVFEFK